MKYAPREVAKDRRMAKSVSFIQSKIRVKVGCKGQKKRRERRMEKVNINMISGKASQTNMKRSREIFWADRKN